MALFFHEFIDSMRVGAEYILAFQKNVLDLISPIVQENMDNIFPSMEIRTWNDIIYKTKMVRKADKWTGLLIIKVLSVSRFSIVPNYATLK